jgi:hypothetical protein
MLCEATDRTERPASGIKDGGRNNFLKKWQLRKKLSFHKNGFSLNTFSDDRDAPHSDTLAIQAPAEQDRSTGSARVWMKVPCIQKNRRIR